MRDEVTRRDNRIWIERNEGSQMQGVKCSESNAGSQMLKSSMNKSQITESMSE